MTTAELLKRLPTAREVRERLAENLAERRTLKQLLKLGECLDAVKPLKTRGTKN